MFCSEVFAIAERYAIQTFSNPGTLVLSSGSSSSEAEVRGANPHIKLVDIGDAAVRIETGWCVRAIADYEIQFEDEPSQAAAAVEAIVLGGAEEYVITDDDDRWVAFGVTVRPGVRHRYARCRGAPRPPTTECLGRAGRRTRRTHTQAKVEAEGHVSKSRT
ncbi:hypothetical protein C5E45_02870 [Nocardia nova]|uniref:Uncharacterized protein n=2 Tax=Nocardia nova TaxID=37330 RepID=A0A2S6AXR6_9NOCA|nr:hypothetical protein C5E41_00630 [Nocardia nova]PPJ40042.1 hypothetical protein C5E45_02870 [Nocardia nova]